MRNFLLIFILFCITWNAYAIDNKQLMKDAIVYAVENMDKNMDYSKYVSKDYIQYIDGETFNYNQWVQHMKDIKAQMQSQKVSFDEVISADNKVAIVERIHGIKKEGGSIEVKVIGIFTIKNNKVINGNELTYLIKGADKDKNIGALR